MASTNQSPQYSKAEAMYLESHTDEERLRWLKEMIKECPRHKSSEKMLSNLKQRYIKLSGQVEKSKKSKAGKAGIKKESMQAVIVGKTMSGKSSLISILTNAKPEIGNYEFTTKFPAIGMTSFEGASIQLVENPAIESEFYDRGLSHTADTLLILITDFNQIQEIEKILGRTTGKKIIVFNKIDTLSEEEKRKIVSKLQSKKYNFVVISTKTKEGLEELKEKIFQSFDKMRIYTKEPGKIKSTRPVILDKDSTVKDVAEKILKGFSKRIKETRIWGPSSKFAGQIIGLSHKLKDMDVVEFKTK
jgi:ribosome-interacting GTPase 1